MLCFWSVWGGFQPQSAHAAPADKCGGAVSPGKSEPKPGTLEWVKQEDEAKRSTLQVCSDKKALNLRPISETQAHWVVRLEHCSGKNTEMDCTEALGMKPVALPNSNATKSKQSSFECQDPRNPTAGFTYINEVLSRMGGLTAETQKKCEQIRQKQSCDANSMDCLSKAVKKILAATYQNLTDGLVAMTYQGTKSAINSTVSWVKNNSARQMAADVASATKKTVSAVGDAASWTAGKLADFGDWVTSPEAKKAVKSASRRLYTAAKENAADIALLAVNPVAFAAKNAEKIKRNLKTLMNETLKTHMGANAAIALSCMSCQKMEEWICEAIPEFTAMILADPETWIAALVTGFTAGAASGVLALKIAKTAPRVIKLVDKFVAPALKSAGKFADLFFDPKYSWVGRKTLAIGDNASASLAKKVFKIADDEVAAERALRKSQTVAKLQKETQEQASRRLGRELTDKEKNTVERFPHLNISTFKDKDQAEAALQAGVEEIERQKKVSGAITELANAPDLLARKKAQEIAEEEIRALARQRDQILASQKLAPEAQEVVNQHFAETMGEIKAAASLRDASSFLPNASEARARVEKHSDQLERLVRRTLTPEEQGLIAHAPEFESFSKSGIASKGDAENFLRVLEDVKKTDYQRTVEKAETSLGRKLTQSEADAVVSAHRAGALETGADGKSLAGAYNLSTQTIRSKTLELQKSAPTLSQAERKKLFDDAVVGFFSSPRPKGPEASLNALSDWARKRGLSQADTELVLKYPHYNWQTSKILSKKAGDDMVADYLAIARQNEQTMARARAQLSGLGESGQKAIKAMEDGQKAAMEAGANYASELSPRNAKQLYNAHPEDAADHIRAVEEARYGAPAGTGHDPKFWTNTKLREEQDGFFSRLMKRFTPKKGSAKSLGDLDPKFKGKMNPQTEKFVASLPTNESGIQWNQFRESRQIESIVEKEKQLSRQFGRNFSKEEYYQSLQNMTQFVSRGGGSRNLGADDLARFHEYWSNKMLFGNPKLPDPKQYFRKNNLDRIIDSYSRTLRENGGKNGPLLLNEENLKNILHRRIEKQGAFARNPAQVRLDEQDLREIGEELARLDLKRASDVQASRQIASEAIAPLKDLTRASSDGKDALQKQEAVNTIFGLRNQRWYQEELLRESSGKSAEEVNRIRAKIERLQERENETTKLWFKTNSKTLPTVESINQHVDGIEKTLKRTLTNEEKLVYAHSPALQQKVLGERLANPAEFENALTRLVKMDQERTLDDAAKALGKKSPAEFTNEQRMAILDAHYTDPLGPGKNKDLIGGSGNLSNTQILKRVRGLSSKFTKSEYQRLMDRGIVGGSAHLTDAPVLKADAKAAIQAVTKKYGKDALNKTVPDFIHAVRASPEKWDEYETEYKRLLKLKASAMHHSVDPGPHLLSEIKALNGILAQSNGALKKYPKLADFEEAMAREVALFKEQLSTGATKNVDLALSSAPAAPVAVKPFDPAQIEKSKARLSALSDPTYSKQVKNMDAPGAKPLSIAERDREIHRLRDALEDEKSHFEAFRKSLPEDRSRMTLEQEMTDRMYDSKLKHIEKLISEGADEVTSNIQQIHSNVRKINDRYSSFYREQQLAQDGRDLSRSIQEATEDAETIKRILTQKKQAGFNEAYSSTKPYRHGDTAPSLDHLEEKLKEIEDHIKDLQKKATK